MHTCPAIQTAIETQDSGYLTEEWLSSRLQHRSVNLPDDVFLSLFTVILEAFNFLELAESFNLLASENVPFLLRVCVWLACGIEGNVTSGIAVSSSELDALLLHGGRRISALLSQHSSGISISTPFPCAKAISSNGWLASTVASQVWHRFVFSSKYLRLSHTWTCRLSLFKPNSLGFVSLKLTVREPLGKSSSCINMWLRVRWSLARSRLPCLPDRLEEVWCGPSATAALWDEGSGDGKPSPTPCITWSPGFCSLLRSVK